MLFSIIMPAYNPGPFLEKSIQSLQNQTCPDWELILINDGSKDHTDTVARHYAAGDSRIRYYTQENMGVSKTRNRAIDLAAGDYILFVDADDEVDPRTLETVRNTLSTDPCDIVVFNAYRSDAQSKVTGRVTRPLSDRVLKLITEQEKKEYIYSALASNRVFGIMGIFAVKREVLSDIRFRTDMIMFEDLLFDMQMYEKVQSIICLPDYFYYYRDNPSGCVRNFNYQKICDLRIAYEAKKAMAQKYDLTQLHQNALLFYCACIISFYHSVLEDKALRKEYRSRILEDEYVLDRFGELNTVQLPERFPSVKILFGSKWERAYYRIRFLLIKKAVKLKRYVRKMFAKKS